MAMFFHRLHNWVTASLVLQACLMPRYESDTEAGSMSEPNCACSKLISMVSIF